MAVVTGPDVAAYLQLDSEDARAEYVATLVDGLIDEKWVTPVDPVPASVKLMALNVAARAYHASPGRGRLESVTRSVDDASRTERYASSAGDGEGVFLTEADLAVLNGGTGRKRVRSMRLRVPGYDGA